MSWTGTRLEWVCEDCEAFEQIGGIQCRGFVNGSIGRGSWVPHVNGIVVSKDDWTEGVLRIKGVIKLDLSRLMKHRMHTVRIKQTGEKLRRVQRIAGMLTEE